MPLIKTDLIAILVFRKFLGETDSFIINIKPVPEAVGLFEMRWSQRPILSVK
jgi:hypothetical protein